MLVVVTDEAGSDVDEVAGVIEGSVGELLATVVVEPGDAVGSSEQAGIMAPSATATTSSGSGRDLTPPSSHRDHRRIGHDGWDATQEEAMRVVVDYDLCESNAVCMAVMPEVFEVRDDDFLYVLNETPPEDQRDKLEEAVRRCPKQAIAIADD